MPHTGKTATILINDFAVGVGVRPCPVLDAAETRVEYCRARNDVACCSCDKS